MGASMGLRVPHLPSLSLPSSGIFSLCRVPGPEWGRFGGVGSGELYLNTLELIDLGCSSGSGATLPKPAPPPSSHFSLTSSHLPGLASREWAMDASTAACSMRVGSV